MTQSANQPAGDSVRYRAGDVVTVRVDNPGGHFRTPTYIQGQTGRIYRLCGVFPNPESLAYGGDGQPAQPLYRVEFPSPRYGPVTADPRRTRFTLTFTSTGWSPRRRAQELHNGGSYD